MKRRDWFCSKKKGSFNFAFIYKIFLFLDLCGIHFFKSYFPNYLLYLNILLFLLLINTQIRTSQPTFFLRVGEDERKFPPMTWLRVQCFIICKCNYNLNSVVLVDNEYKLCIHTHLGIIEFMRYILQKSGKFQAIILKILKILKKLLMGSGWQLHTFAYSVMS